MGDDLRRFGLRDNDHPVLGDREPPPAVELRVVPEHGVRRRVRKRDRRDAGLPGLRHRHGRCDADSAQCAAHEQHTAAIVRLETALNARVYALFDLTPAEIALIEQRTKYLYGEI